MLKLIILTPIYFLISLGTVALTGYFINIAVENAEEYRLNADARQEFYEMVHFPGPPKARLGTLIRWVIRYQPKFLLGLIPNGL